MSGNLFEDLFQDPALNFLESGFGCFDQAYVAGLFGQYAVMIVPKL